MRTRFQKKLEKRPKTGKINMFNLQEKSTEFQQVGQILYTCIILHLAPLFYFVMCTNLKNLIKKPLRKGVKYNTLIRMERRKKFRETKGYILGDNKNYM